MGIRTFQLDREFYPILIRTFHYVCINNHTFVSVLRSKSASEAEEAAAALHANHITFEKNLKKLQEGLDENQKTFVDANKKFLFYIQKYHQPARVEEVTVAKKETLVIDDAEEPPFTGTRIPVIVFACNRVSISICLDNLIKYRPHRQQFPIIVSQDCGDEATKNVVLSYGNNVTLIEHPDLSDITVPPKDKKFKGYYKISRHYGWALNKVFGQSYEYAIIVEDDLNVAPDFYEYFLGTYPLLKQDPSLW